MRLILGSSSVGRQAILKRVGYDFEIIKPEIDEKSIRCDDPRELVLKLSNAKADAIMQKLGSGIEPGTIIITSDQVVVCNGQIIEKPKDEQECRYFISLYHKYPSEIVNGMVLTDSTNKRTQGVDVSKTILKEPLPADVIEQIIQKGNVLHCSGGIQFEDPLVAQYVGQSDSTEDKLRGMPLELFKKLLSELHNL